MTNDAWTMSNRCQTSGAATRRAAPWPGSARQCRLHRRVLQRTRATPWRVASEACQGPLRCGRSRRVGRRTRLALRSLRLLRSCRKPRSRRAVGEPKPASTYQRWTRRTCDFGPRTCSANIWPRPSAIRQRPSAISTSEHGRTRGVPDLTKRRSETLAPRAVSGNGSAFLKNCAARYGRLLTAIDQGA